MVKTTSINVRHNDIEFLISHWSIETHTFIAAWREFDLTLEDVMALSYLPIFGEETPLNFLKTDEISLEEANNKNLRL